MRVKKALALATIVLFIRFTPYAQKWVPPKVDLHGEPFSITHGVVPGRTCIIAGVVQYDSHVPAPDASITLKGPNGFVATANTDHEGRFCFENLQPASAKAYVIYVRKKGYGVLARQLPALVAGDYFYASVMISDYAPPGLIVK